jgi:hypothetical protein
MYAVTVTFNEQYFQKLLFDLSLISVFHFNHLDLVIFLILVPKFIWKLRLEAD